MTSLTLGKLFLLFSLCSEVKSNYISSCNRKISIYCGKLNSKMLILDVNGTSSFSRGLLEKCNAHGKCDVPNINGECVRISYMCTNDQITLTLNDSSTIQFTTKSKQLWIMSENYARSQYQSAENINCTVQTSDLDDTADKSVSFNIYEFAPFLATSEYCMGVEYSTLPPFCSGSGKLHTTYGPFAGNNDWQFNIMLTESATEVPQIRYWIGMNVHGNKSIEYQLTCHVKSATLGQMASKPVWPYILGFFPGLSIVVIFYVNKNLPWIYNLFSSGKPGEDNDYSSIDDPSIDLKEELDRKSMSPDEVQLQILATLNLQTPLTKNKGRVAFNDTEAPGNNQGEKLECEAMDSQPLQYDHSVTKNAEIQVHAEQNEADTKKATTHANEYTTLNANDTDNDYKSLVNRESDSPDEGYEFMARPSRSAHGESERPNARIRVDSGDDHSAPKYASLTHSDDHHDYFVLGNQGSVKKVQSMANEEDRKKKVVTKYVNEELGQSQQTTANETLEEPFPMLSLSKYEMNV